MFELINTMEEILTESIIYQESCGFTICKELPDLVVHKICKKITKLQEMEIISKEKQAIVEYLDIALRNYNNLVNSDNRQRLVETVADFAMKSNNDLSDFSITDPDHREQLKNYAVQIMRQNPDCDPHKALACAMKDCDPAECDQNDDQYFAHVEQHFNEEDIEEVTNRARGNQNQDYM